MHYKSNRNIHKKRGLFKCLFLIFLFVTNLCVQGNANEHSIVKKIYNGKSIKLSDGKKITYIGLSAPDKKGKPFYTMCKEANKSLVDKKRVAILTDLSEKGDDGKVSGYVYAGEVFVNAELIKNGYALVRILPLNDHYKEYFLSLQKEARKNRRGLWAFEDMSNEPYYVGSKSKKVFHRPKCFHVENIDFDDRIIFRTKDEALNKRFVQDWRCCPLFKEPGDVKR